MAGWRVMLPRLTCLFYVKLIGAVLGDLCVSIRFNGLFTSREGS